MKTRTIEEIIEDMTELLREVYTMGLETGWLEHENDKHDINSNSIIDTHDSR